MGGFPPLRLEVFMNFKDQIAKDLAVFFNKEEHADLVLYNSMEIVAIVEIGEDNAKGNTFSQQGSSDRAFFEVQELDVPEPQLGDTITYKNKTWHYAHIVNYSTGVYRIECTANESAM